MEGFPRCFQIIVDCVDRWVCRKDITNLIREFRNLLALTIPVDRTKNSPKERACTISDVVCGISSCRQIMNMNVIAFNSRHLSTRQRRTVRIDVEHIDQILFDISIHSHSCFKTVADTRNAVCLIQTHMPKMRSYSGIIVVTFYLWENKISLNPKLPLVRCL
ncbi:hypothetical protein AD953_04720 [Acetobacter malorum]|uniref:Uncharacterized protein n=1 Tax=Acetobacter malorum TaxID=178901 RepID=A0A149VAZ2_9PROT|nr:hypothetical protein AD953_04720 [Acetobacter malorum]